MNPKITLPLLFAVTVFKTSVAVKCTEPFTCLSREECLAAHEPFGGLKSNEVFFMCSRGRNKRVCCPELPASAADPVPSTSTSAPAAIMERTTSSSSTTPSIVDPKLHRNFQLLPLVDNCGRAALDKLKNDAFDPATASFDNKVIDGKEAKEGAYPWMALLFFESNKDPKKQARPKCGGTLINARYILTAAHCFNGTEDRIKYVRLAEYDTRVQNCIKKTKRCAKNIKVDKIIIHEDFNITTVKNDIALIRLEKNVLPTDNPKIGPICLPFDTDTRNAPDEEFRLAGWGKTDKDARVGSTVLQEVTIQVTGLCSTCPEGRPSPLAICPLSETEQLCLQVNKKKSPCQGDSGGPLMKQIEPNHFVQVGIISLMPGACGDTGVPAIYTRVDGYLLWILDNIKP